MKRKIDYPTGNDDPCYNRQERGIRYPSLSLAGDGVSENGGEEGGGGADCLVKRHRNEPERNVATNDGEGENDAECDDLPELALGAQALQRNHVRYGNNVAEKRTQEHVTRGEENREPEAVAAQQVLVEKEHTDVGTVPRNHHPYGCPWNLVHPFLNSR